MALEPSHLAREPEERRYLKLLDPLLELFRVRVQERGHALQLPHALIHLRPQSASSREEEKLARGVSRCVRVCSWVGGTRSIASSDGCSCSFFSRSLSMMATSPLVYCACGGEACHASAAAAAAGFCKKTARNQSAHHLPILGRGQQVHLLDQGEVIAPRLQL